MARLKPSRIIGAAAALALASPASAVGIDLGRASVEHLANGLTVIVLEDHSFPLVSAQMFYKSGSRDEVAGKTGLAHFLEHLAFRASEHFPKAGATEAIYDAGGEWHGYTWLDETTYFATMPKGGLDLLLRIEADRMARVTIDPAAIEAEKGAVLTEMHGYENDPDSVLLDALTATAITAHPYRNNTIGFEGDVRALTLADARDYYDRHYAPANAVLAIAGDVDPAEARALVAKYFASLPVRPLASRTQAVEPAQAGERRAKITGAVATPHFAIAFPAPAASSPDFPAYLVLQQLLAGGSGVNFHQNDWGNDAVSGSTLAGAAPGIQSWFVPTADPYVFVIKGTARSPADIARIENEIARRLPTVGDASSARLAAAKIAVLNALADDVQTTEDAAHQLAYFEGIGALDQLIGLNRSIAAVTMGDIRRLAATYLAPDQKTIVWMVPGPPRHPPRPGVANHALSADRKGLPDGNAPAPPPVLQRLAGGFPVIVHPSALNNAVTVELVAAAPLTGGSRPRELGGLGAVVRSGSPDRLAVLLAAAKQAMAKPALAAEPASDDPAERMQQLISKVMAAPPAPLLPIGLIIAGDVDPGTALAEAKSRFGGLHSAPPRATAASASAAASIRERISRPLSQGSVGYVVRVPAQSTRDGLAARLVLWILTHDYSGRLGRSAIGDKGLAYHIYSALRSDGSNAWATLWSGIDPVYADGFEAELRAQVKGLAAEPPSAAELATAKANLLGRELSAAQSNDELTAKLARDLVDTGDLRSHAELERALAAISVADVGRAAQAFGAGTFIRIDVGEAR